MAFELPLPAPFPAQDWKVKIRDKERAEPPHVTILHRRRAWRFGLRERAFLDDEPPPREVPREIVEAILAAYDWLCAEWNLLYPHNPVSSAP